MSDEEFLVIVIVELSDMDDENAVDITTDIQRYCFSFCLDLLDECSIKVVYFQLINKWSVG